MLVIEICNALLIHESIPSGPAPLERGEDLSQGYVTFQDISAIPENTVAGWVGIDYMRMQLNCYHKEKLQAVKLALRVKSLFANKNLYCECSIAGERSSHDTETLLHCQQIDFFMTQSNDC